VIPNVENLVSESPLWALCVVFWFGAMASLGSCTAIRLPIVISCVAGAGTHKKRAVVLTCLFAVGVVASYVLLGALMMTAGGIVGKLLHINRYFYWLLGVLLILTGLFVSGLISTHLLPEKWRVLGSKLQKGKLVGMLLLGVLCGLLVAPGSSSCGVGLLTLARIAVAEKLSAYGLLMFVSYAIGQSLPILGVGVLTALVKPDVIGKARSHICSLEQRIQLVAGNALMVLGIYLIVVG
jgi:cytochrome c biogenesis protein CcdA